MKNKICKLCKGKCCKGGNPHLSKRELRVIEKELGRKIKTVKKGKLYTFVSPHKHCLFLKGGGCGIKNKPLTCELYPFIPTKVGWVIRTWCPYWNLFTKDDLEIAKDEFAQRKNDWSINL